ncbi:MAG: glycosyltransferase family 2 protein [Pseudomonadota bacterium]
MSGVSLGEQFRQFKHRRRLSRAKQELASRAVEPRPHGLDTPLVVTLTSFPPRFAQLHLTLGCLLKQTVQPDRVVLWIAEDDLGDLPPAVRALKAQGLDIRGCPDRRSYKKILFSLDAFPDATLVTADDDVYYGADWLAELVAARQETGARVICTRGHRVALDDAGLPKPYEAWEMNASKRGQSGLVFPTGVMGVLYAPGCFDEAVHDWDLASRLCPDADDIWLYWMHRLAGEAALNLAGRRRILEWERDAPGSLLALNAGGGNDRQIAAMTAHFGFPGPET